MQACGTLIKDRSGSEQGSPFDRLPLEMLAMILTGMRAKGGAPFLAVRWHPLARAVCRLWRAVLDETPPLGIPESFSQRETSPWRVPFSLLRDIDAFADADRWRQTADEIDSICNVDDVGLSLVVLDALGARAVSGVLDRLVARGNDAIGASTRALSAVLCLPNMFDAIDGFATATTLSARRDHVMAALVSAATAIGLEGALDALSCQMPLGDLCEARRDCLVGAARCRRTATVLRMAASMDEIEFAKVLPSLWIAACDTAPVFDAIVNRHWYPRVTPTIPLALVNLAKPPSASSGHRRRIVDWIASMDTLDLVASVVGVAGVDFATALCSMRARTVADGAQFAFCEMDAIHHCMLMAARCRGQDRQRYLGGLADDNAILWVSIIGQRSDLCAWALDHMTRCPSLDAHEMRLMLQDCIDYIICQVAPCDDAIVALLVRRGFVPMDDALECHVSEWVRVFRHAKTDDEKFKAARSLGLILVRWPNRARITRMTAAEIRHVGTLAAKEALKNGHCEYAARLAAAVTHFAN
jgi:hypothetical protein